MPSDSAPESLVQSPENKVQLLGKVPCGDFHTFHSWLKKRKSLDHPKEKVPSAPFG